MSGWGTMRDLLLRSGLQMGALLGLGQSTGNLTMKEYGTMIMLSDGVDDDDTGSCGICGVDPVEHEAVKIGLALVNICRECYENYKEREL